MGLFGTLGLHIPVRDLSASEWATTIRPNSYELWFNGKPLPRLCQPTSLQ